ncbi:response regulator transcription factor [Agromyces mediolanus]|uniref:response regulator n=1 Tax=Agromyces mediolanus TaxID=41986 RepID=UPI0038375515
MIRVLVVDDQSLVRAGFRTILDSEPGIEVVGEAEDGELAVARTLELAPDVVCMDVQMPNVDGLEATRRLTADPRVDAAVLVLTTFDREDYLFAALEAGASGFLLKNSSPERLIDAVQVLAGGEALLAPDVTRRVIEAARRHGVLAAGGGGRSGEADAPAGTTGAAGADASTGADASIGSASDDPSSGGTAARGGATAAGGPLGRATPSPDAGHGRTDGAGREGASASGTAAGTPPELDTLTEREREVLVLLAEGLSNAEIAARMWVGEATVKSHVSKVLMKLGLRDRVHAVVYAYEHGVVSPAV